MRISSEIQASPKPTTALVSPRTQQERLNAFFRAALALSLCVGAALSSAPVRAEEPVEFQPQRTSFFFNSFQSAYACSYATEIAESALTALGARRSWVRCSGGLPWNSTLFIDLEFEAARSSQNPQAETGVWRPVRFRGSQACDLNVRILREILARFQVRNARLSDACWRSQGSFDLRAEVLTQ
jgi:hypothetical protein